MPGCLYEQQLIKLAAFNNWTPHGGGAPLRRAPKHTQTAGRRALLASPYPLITPSFPLSCLISSERLLFFPHTRFFNLGANLEH